MTISTLERIEAISTPFDDTFDDELLRCGPTLEPFPIWTECGRRVDLVARTIGWQTLSLRQVMEDAEATWNGDDASAWDRDEVSC